DALRPTATYEWRDPTLPSRTLPVALAGAALFTTGAALAVHLGKGSNDITLTAITIVAVLAGATLLLPTAVPAAAHASAAAFARISPITGRFAGDALRANPRRTTYTVTALLLPLATVVALGSA